MAMKPNKQLDLILTKEFLQLEYVQNKKTCSQIAREVGICTYVGVKNRLKRFGIPIKSVWHEYKIAKQQNLENQQLKFKDVSFYVECKLCGVKKQHLCYHLNNVHNISTHEYKQLFPGSKICSEAFSIKKKITQLGRKYDNTTREKHSELTSERMMAESQGKYPARKSNYKTGRVSVLGVSQYYRSSYEQLGLIYLNTKADELKILLNEHIRLPYVDFNNVRRNTLPDWLITLHSGETFLVEVKPIHKLKNQVVCLKMETARLWAETNNIKYCVWTEDIIFKLSSTTMSLKEILEATVTHQLDLVNGIV